MLRLLIYKQGEGLYDIVEVLEWDTDVLTNQIWRARHLAVQSNYRFGDILKWDLVRVERPEDPWTIRQGYLRIIYGEHLAFGQMGDLFPNRVWMSAWRWVGTTCEKIMERSFVNAY